MTFTPDYTEGDISTALVSGFTKFTITVGLFIVVIVGALFIIWLSKNTGRNFPTMDEFRARKRK